MHAKLLHTHIEDRVLHVRLAGWITETPKITQHVAERVSQSLHSAEAWDYREEEEEVESEVLARRRHDNPQHSVVKRLK